MKFVRNEHGVVCFRENTLVRYLLDQGGIHCGVETET